MENACRYIEQLVNEAIKTRPRFKQEWGGDEVSSWKANVAASNCYQGGKESVGFHSDQLTYLGPYPTIASLSLGILFRLSANCYSCSCQALDGFLLFVKWYQLTKLLLERHGPLIFLFRTIQCVISLEIIPTFDLIYPFIN